MSRRLCTIALLFASGLQPAFGGEAALARTPSTSIDPVAAEFCAEFGAPTSSEFQALDSRTREAVERFFLHGPGAVRRHGTIDSSFGSAAQAGSHRLLGGSHLVTRGDPVPGYPGLVNLTIGNTGSGYLESFLLQIPDTTPTGPTPLLVAFHKFGVSHGDVVFHTSFIAEVRARGWYLVAPLGATQTNFGSLPSQINTRAALDWTRTYFSSIDENRIYGVGFSMGGGGAATYAARHLDPAGARFAAILDHTGTISLAHAHANESAGVQQILQGWFGGTPAAQPFAYQRCSTIDLDPVTNLVGAGTDMARNLGSVHTWLADNDPNVYLPLQTMAFHGHVQALDPSAVLTVVSANVHSWSTLDCAAACTWFASHTLQRPTAADTLADEDGVWHHFLIEQDAPGAFTPFSWQIDALTNRLALSSTSNLRRVTVEAEAAGLVYQGQLRLDLSSADATGDQVLFLAVPSAPIAVTRNGVSATGVYDAQASSFLVDETSGAASAWILVF